MTRLCGRQVTGTFESPFLFLLKSAKTTLSRNGSVFFKGPQK